VIIWTVPRFFDHWLQAQAPFPHCPDLRCFEEVEGGRALIETALRNALTDHLIGLELLERLVTTGALAAALQRVPKSARERSGDFGEVLASSWIEEATTFHLPVRRLRFKADREFPMQGDDLIALSDDEVPRLLKGEAKSRAILDEATIDRASDALNARDGRPKSETLGFLSMRLRETGNDDLAERVETFLDDCDDDQLEHLLFTVSGNDRRDLLEGAAASTRVRIRRHVVGVAVNDHQALIREAFDAVAELVGG
jgi:hypothetical protein